MLPPTAKDVRPLKSLFVWKLTRLFWSFLENDWIAGAIVGLLIYLFAMFVFAAAAQKVALGG